MGMNLISSYIYIAGATMKLRVCGIDWCGAGDEQIKVQPWMVYIKVGREG
jgi:hypothetical protein